MPNFEPVSSIKPDSTKPTTDIKRPLGYISPYETPEEKQKREEALHEEIKDYRVLRPDNKNKREFNMASFGYIDPTEKKEIRHSAKIIICGPPDSGKTVFSNALLKYLPGFSTNYIQAQPDSTGPWYMDTAQFDPVRAKELQSKGVYNSKNVSIWKNWIKHSSSRVNIIDIGGKVDSYSEELCSEANAMIIISKYPIDHPDTQQFIKLAQRNRLNILGVYTTYLNPEDVPESLTRDEDYVDVSNQDKDWETEGYLVGLDRKTFVSSETIGFIAQSILDRVPKYLEESPPEGYSYLNISDIASWSNMFETATDEKGQEVLRTSFKPENLPTIIEQIREKRGYHQKYVLNGFAVQWLAIAIVFYSYPTEVALYDPKLKKKYMRVDVEDNLPSGTGSGPLVFEGVKTFKDGSLVQHSKGSNRVYLEESDFDKIIPPEVDLNKPVYISGATSNWANAKIALAYSRIVPAVYILDPRVGYVCCISRDEKFPLGSVVTRD